MGRRGRDGGRPITMEPASQAWDATEAALRAENALLKERVAELEGRCGAPPSSDAIMGEGANGSGSGVLRRQKSCRDRKDWEWDEESALIADYDKSGNAIAPVWRKCREAWTEGMYLPMAARLQHTLLPRVDFDAMVAAMDATEKPLYLELEDASRRADSFPSHSDLTPCHANKNHVRFSGGDLREMQQWRARAGTQMRWLQFFEESFFERSDSGFFAPLSPQPGNNRQLTPRRALDFLFPASSWI